MAQPMFPSQPDHHNHHACTLQGQQKSIHGSVRGLSRYVVEQTADMPLSAMQPFTATPTGRIPHTTPISSALATDRTDSPPARWFRRNGVAVTDTNFKTPLGRIDLVHALPKPGPMPLPTFQNEIHPGVNHLVTKGALRRLLRQGLEQRARQHDLAATCSSDTRTTAIEPCCPAHAAIAPTNRNTWLPGTDKHAVEVFTIEAMKQRQQG